MNIELIENKMKTLCDLNSFTLDNVTEVNRIEKHHIFDIENRFNVALPVEYKWFLSKYGYWGLDFEVLGIVIANPLLFDAMTMTDFKKSNGFPDNYLVIENVDEFQYCLNLEDGSVGVWERMVGTMAREYDSFFSYFADRLDDCIENTD